MYPEIEWAAEVPITVKSIALVPVPAAVVTEIRPVVAPVGTVAVIWVADTKVNVAATLLNFTAVAPVKFVPLIDRDHRPHRTYAGLTAPTPQRRRRALIRRRSLGT